jgi:hypothetical protein
MVNGFKLEMSFEIEFDVIDSDSRRIPLFFEVRVQNGPPQTVRHVPQIYKTRRLYSPANERT